MTPLPTSKTTHFGPLRRNESKCWHAWALGGASSRSVSTATKRTGLNIILTLDHAAVGRERMVVPDDGSQIRLTPDYKNTHSIKVRSASPHGKHHGAVPQQGFDLAGPCASLFTTLRERDDLLLESPVSLLRPSARKVTHPRRSQPQTGPARQGDSGDRNRLREVPAPPQGSRLRRTILRCAYLEIDGVTRLAVGAASDVFLMLLNLQQIALRRTQIATWNGALTCIPLLAR